MDNITSCFSHRFTFPANVRHCGSPEALSLDQSESFFPVFSLLHPSRVPLPTLTQTSWVRCCRYLPATVRQCCLRMAQLRSATTRRSRTARMPRMLQQRQSPSNAPLSSMFCHGNVSWQCQRRGRVPRSCSQMAGRAGKEALWMAMPLPWPTQARIA